MAEDELALAERLGAPVPIAGALHARAVAEPDAAERVATALLARMDRT